MIRNKRDLGGIRTKDGRTIRPGMLIRSADLSEAEALELSGISAVIDLRTPFERAEAPDRTYGRQYLPLPIFEDAAPGISRESDGGDAGFPELAPLYRRLAAECRDRFRAVLQAVMAHDFSKGAVLWHCSEGKDRCGLTTALILEALGADRDAIMADYLKTNETSLPRAAAIRARLLPTRGEAFAQSVYRAYIADESYLKAAWEAMDGALSPAWLSLP